MAKLTEGVETVLVYPEVPGDDGAGTPTRVPSATPVEIDACWVYPVSSSEAQALGESIATVYAVVARSFPGGGFARVTWDGRDWDPLGEPLRYRSGFTGTRLDVVYIKARTPEAM